MTEASQRFITPLSLEIASQNRVYCSLFNDPLAHIRLPAAADLFIVAPATANSIAKFALGQADDLLSTCFLASTGKKIIIAPAMNWRMYENPSFRRNLDLLLASGVIQVGPETGPLACGEEGTGRMAEVPEIIDAAVSVLSRRTSPVKRLSSQRARRESILIRYGLFQIAHQVKWDLPSPELHETGGLRSLW